MNETVQESVEKRDVAELGDIVRWHHCAHDYGAVPFQVVRVDGNSVELHSIGARDGDFSRMAFASDLHVIAKAVAAAPIEDECPTCGRAL